MYMTAVRLLTRSFSGPATITRSVLPANEMPHHIMQEPPEKDTRSSKQYGVNCSPGLRLTFFHH